MEQQEINKRNEAIAKFMELKSFNDDRYGKIWASPVNKETSFSLQYNSSWSWLMPVVEKISQDLMHSVMIDTFGGVEIYSHKNNGGGDPIITIDLDGNKPLIEAVFLAVSDYCLTKEADK
jgi:hypothetical protein